MPDIRSTQQIKKHTVIVALKAQYTDTEIARPCCKRWLGKLD